MRNGASPATAVVIGAVIIAIAILVGTIVFPRYEPVRGGWRDRWTGDVCTYVITDDWCYWDNQGLRQSGMMKRPRP